MNLLNLPEGIGNTVRNVLSHAAGYRNQKVSTLYLITSSSDISTRVAPLLCQEAAFLQYRTAEEFTIHYEKPID